MDLHDLAWFVHVDLINPGLGEDLAFWQAVIDARVSTANLLLEGAQGPVDEPCCTRLARSASVATFGSPGDGFDVIDTETEENALSGIGGSGSRAFLVDSISSCGGPSPGSIGCAQTPSCNGNGGDDPNLWMVVTVDSLDQGTLASVIGHERGHNACLNHVSAAKCQLMQATVFTPGLGGCLVASECSNFQAARTQTSSGIDCGCHDDVGGLLEDGSICSEVASGICSGGVCGDPAGDAAVHLYVAADPGDAELAPEHAIKVSGLSGDWTDLGQIGPGAEDVRAMAYARDSDTLYGVVPSVFDDSLITIDPATGAQIAVVGTIANGTDEIVSMAYDPGPTSAAGDDRLLVLEVGATGELREIDPESPSTAALVGQILIGPASEFKGMAYDSIQDRLFMMAQFSPTGFFEVDLTTCPPTPCFTSSLPSWTPIFRENASLAYSPETGMLYAMGNAFGDPSTRTFYDVIDPMTGIASPDTLSLDRFTPDALAAVPEPGSVIGITAGLLALALTAPRKARRKGGSASLDL